MRLGLGVIDHESLLRQTPDVRLPWIEDKVMHELFVRSLDDDLMSSATHPPETADSLLSQALPLPRVTIESTAVPVVVAKENDASRQCSDGVIGLALRALRRARSWTRPWSGPR